MGYIWDKAREASRGQINRNSFIRWIPTDVVPDGNQKNRKGELKKDRPGEKKAKNRQKKRESDSFLETWSQDFGAVCSVYMTSCTVFHYLHLLDTERLRLVLRNGK